MAFKLVEGAQKSWRRLDGCAFRLIATTCSD